MYEIADKYDVVGLKDFARAKFKHSCSVFWNDEAFPTAAHYALSTTRAEDKGLRDVISSTISEHVKLMEKPEMLDLLAEQNGLALDTMVKGVKEHGWGKIDN
jgi:hypothetical protein